MGVDLSVYTVIGVRITDQEQIEYIESVIGENPDYYQSRECEVSVIVDGMSGKYIVIGDIIGEGSRYDETVTISSFSYINGMFEDMPEMIREEFPDLKFGEISLITFPHYY